MIFPWKQKLWLPGVLNKRQTLELANEKLININTANVGFSSFDLTLSSEGWEMINGSIKPIKSESYGKVLDDKGYALKLNIESDKSFLLKKGKCYVFKLKENISALKHKPIYGQATAKSTIGRLDAIARLIVDGMNEYENFDPDHIFSGDLYLEISPLSFSIKVREDNSLSQMRLFYSEIENAILDSKSFSKSLIVNEEDGMDNFGSLSVNLAPTDIPKANVKGTAYKARRQEVDDYIDLEKIGQYNPSTYWEIKSSSLVHGKHRMKIETDEFYIIRSKEKICLPRNVAVYCKAMDESLGEMRIHYAGFVHPFFGYDIDDENNPFKGTPLIFEVRGHNIDVNLVDSEKLALLTFYRMSDDAQPNDDNTFYNNQVLKLSKYFNDNWE